MKGNDLSYFNIDTGEFKLKLRRGVDAEVIAEAIANAQASAAPAPAPVAAPAPAPAAAAPAAAPAAAAPAESEGESLPTINSLMVGTFYRAPSPDADPYVKVGDVVDEDTTVCIVEAMKVMNEIKAEMKGTISRVVAADGTPVQYGEPLFEIKP